MKNLRTVLGLGQLPYLYVYGWAFKTLAGWGGFEITILQGVLLDLAFSLATPIGLAHFAEKTYFQTRKKNDDMDEDAHGVVCKVAWYIHPPFLVGAGWLFKWALA